MFTDRVVVEVQHLAGHDPMVCDGAELESLVEMSGRVRSWLDAYDTRLARRAGELRRGGQGATPTEVLAAGGRSRREAATVERRAEVLDQLPAVQDALVAGQVSAGHVDHLARAVGVLDEAGRAQLTDLQDELIAAAGRLSVDEYGREVGRLERILSPDDGLAAHAANRRARRVKRWTDRVTGMCHTHLELDAETDAKVAVALDAAVAAARAKEQDRDLTFDQLQADVLVDLITRPDAAVSTAERKVPEVIVLIDLDTLTHGRHDQTVGETADGHRLPVAALRRMCCDAVVVPVVLNGAGVVLDVGRQRRTASRDQRRALRAMYTTCGYPGCTVRFEHCQIHHVIPWEQGGMTSLANLLPFCSRHHHQVHEGGWQLTLTADRTVTLTLTRPDGNLHHQGSTITRAPTGVRRQPDVQALRTEIAEQLSAQLRSRPRARAPPPEPATTRAVKGAAAGRARTRSAAKSRSDP